MTMANHFSYHKLVFKYTMPLQVHTSAKVYTNLHNVVFTNRTYDPRFIGVPGKVGDLGSVATMDKLQKKFNINHTPVSRGRRLDIIDKLSIQHKLV